MSTKPKSNISSFDWRMGTDPSVEERVQKLREMLAFGVKRVESDPKKLDWQMYIEPYLTVHSYALKPHPTITFRMETQPMHANGSGNMHGGCTASVFDFCTSWPLHLISQPGAWQHLGVSRTLNCTYLRPVPIAATIDIQCEAIQHGAKMAVTRGMMRAVKPDGSLGPVLTICEHGKFNTDPPAPKL